MCWAEHNYSQKLHPVLFGHWCYQSPLCQKLALGKAMDVAKKHEGENAIIIGADSFGIIDGKFIGKPDSAEEAKNIAEAALSFARFAYEINKADTGKAIAEVVWANQVAAYLMVGELGMTPEVIGACADGEAAETALRNRGFDVAVLDFSMPFHSGFDLLSWLRARRRERPLKVVVLVDQHVDKLTVQAFSLGADDVVVKPFDPPAVANRIGQLVLAD